MDVLECIKNRRSRREYLEKDIPDNIIKDLVDAASCAPFGGPPKPQCQIFEAIIIRDKATKEKLALDFDDRQFIKKAPVIIACLANKDNDPKYKEWNTSAALAIQNLILAAESQNIGCCFISCFLNHDEHKHNKQALREILELPPHIELVALVSLGYKADSENMKNKTLKDYKDIAFYEKYGTNGGQNENF